MTTLTVGQKIWMQSGPLRKEALVVEVWDQYVGVEIAVAPVEGSKQTPRYALYFDVRDGKQCGTLLRIGGGWEDYDHRLASTEFGPWELGQINS